MDAIGYYCMLCEMTPVGPAGLQVTNVTAK